MIRTSEQIDALSASLALAQSKFGAAIKTAQNPAFRSKYADLSSVIDATLEHLNAEGVSVLQHPSLEYKETHSHGEVQMTAFVTVTTRLQHKSGQWMESDCSIPAMMRDRFDAQSVGSAITYGCRYALQSILCVPREDDDGNRAVGMGTREEAQAVAQEKIAALEAKKGKKDAPSAPVFVPSLFYAKMPSGLYAITGDKDLLNTLYKQPKLKAKWFVQDRCFMVDEELLEQVKFQCESAQPPIPMSVLHGN